MRTKIGIGLRAYNVFEFELRNTATGEVKYYKSHNIVLNNMVQLMVTNPIGNGNIFNVNRIRVGIGTGTLSPSRTSLFGEIFSAEAARQASNLNDDPAWARYTATLTETQGNGNLTEVGLGSQFLLSGSQRIQLFTHSLITDAEGNHISIPKTNLDILTITATLYASFEAVETPGIKVPKFPEVVRPVAQGDNPTVVRHSDLIWKGVGNSTSSFPNSNVSFLGTYHKTNHLGAEEGASGNHRVFAFSGGGTITPDGNLGRVRNTRSVTSAQGNLNGGPYLIKAIRYRGLAEIQLPNFDIFPRRSAEFAAGVGDGIRTGFNINLPQCNTGDEEIYIDNVLQDPSTYDFNGKNLTYTQAWRSTDVFYLMEGSGYARNSSNAKWIFFPQGSDSSTGIYDFLWADAERPFIFDFEEPVKVNRLQGVAAALSNLEYSHDLTTWTRVVTNQINVSFDTIEARYWKFWPSTAFGANVAQTSTSMLVAFDELRDGLIFDTPPPDGAVIRAIVTSDYPWKDSNWQIDIETDFFLSNLSGA